MRLWQLIFRHYPGPHRGKGIQALSPEPLIPQPLLPAHLDIAGRDIIKDGITRYILISLSWLDSFPLPADNYCQLYLIIQGLGFWWIEDIVIRAINTTRGLREKDRGFRGFYIHLCLFQVLFIISPEGNNLGWVGFGSSNLGSVLGIKDLSG